MISINVHFPDESMCSLEFSAMPLPGDMVEYETIIFRVRVVIWIMVAGCFVPNVKLEAT